MKTLAKDILVRVLWRLAIKRIRFDFFHRKFRSVLIFAPHPDDEIIGIGGMILRILKEGTEVHIVYLTDGEKSGASLDEEMIRKARIGLMIMIAKDIGIPLSNLYWLHIPDGTVPHHRESGFIKRVNQLSHLINWIKPDAVFATHDLDYWPLDHVACSELAVEAVKRSDHKPELWLYWVWTWYHLRPWNFLKLNMMRFCKVKISKELKRKEELMNRYLTPKSSEGKPWSGVLPKSMLYPFTKPFEVLERYEYL